MSEGTWGELNRMKRRKGLTTFSVVFFISQFSFLQNRAYSEQIELYGKELAPVNYDLVSGHSFAGDILITCCCGQIGDQFPAIYGQG